MTKTTFILINDRVRQNAAQAVANAPDEYTVTIAPRKRSGEQNAHFHALCSDLARSSLEWAGERRSMEVWKVLLISAHATATGIGAEVLTGLEGELVSIRESSASMSVSRASSLIEYAIAYCVSNNIELRDTRRGGFQDERSASA